MSEITELDLKKQIKEKKYSNLYFLYGEEKYLIRHYTNFLVKKIVPSDFSDFNLHIYDGKDSQLDDISAAVEALPMMSEYTCILIKDMPVDSLISDDNDKLIDMISDIPQSTIIIISLLSIDSNMKGAKGKKVLSEFVKYGSVINFSHASISQLSRLIEKGALDRNCTFSSSDASYLISLVGDDMTVLLNELEKVCAYKKEGKITRADIDAVVVKNVQAKAFDLAKALTAGNCDSAMSILDSLLAMKEEPVNILAAVITPYIDMYRARVYISGGLRADDAAKDFNYKNKEFRLTNASRNSSKLSIGQLRQFLEVLYEADTKLKSTSMGGRLILEETITKLLLVSNGEKI